MSAIVHYVDQLAFDAALKRVDKALVAGKLKLPFGGKLRGSAFKPHTLGGAMVAAPPCGVNADAGGSGIMNYIMSLAEGCKPRGARPPQDCVDANGCIRTRGTRLCGLPGPYLEADIAAGASEEYELKALDWFLPLIWVDNSGADISITNLSYKGGPVWGTPNVAVTPAGVFGAGDAPRYVPGLPGIDSTDGLKFSLSNGHATDAQSFEGMFIGIGTLP